MSKPDVTRSNGGRTIRCVALLLTAIVLAGCSTTNTASAPTPTAPGTAAAGPASLATSKPGTTVPSVASDGRLLPKAITIATVDPAWGPLTFDAIASGDPAAAKQGKLVLLLHGFPETDQAYSDQLVELARAGYYAVAPNQRGYSPGARPTDVKAYDVVTLSGDVLAMATALGADQFNLVGHDWGAAVAWVTAVTSPQRVRTLTALSVPHPDAFNDAFHDPGGDQTKKSGYMKVFSQPNSEDQFVANDNAGLKVIYGTMPKAKADTYLQVLGSKEALGAALNWYRANPLPTDVRLGPAKVPTLFIYSTGDGALSRVGADLTVKYVEAPYEYEILDGVSHWIPEEASDRVTQLLLAHLAKFS